MPIKAIMQSAQCIDHTLILLTVGIRLRTAQTLPPVSNFINTSHEVYNYFIIIYENRHQIDFEL